jgi:hypothetical protein
VRARRVLNGAFHETLVEVKEDDRTFAYSIDDGPSPVSKADVSNYVAEFCHGIYVALLSDMKKSLEQ